MPARWTDPTSAPAPPIGPRRLANAPPLCCLGTNAPDSIASVRQVDRPRLSPSGKRRVVWSRSPPAFELRSQLEIGCDHQPPTQNRWSPPVSVLDTPHPGHDGYGKWSTNPCRRTTIARSGTSRDDQACRLPTFYVPAGGTNLRQHPEVNRRRPAVSAGAARVRSGRLPLRTLFCHASSAILQRMHSFLGSGRCPERVRTRSICKFAQVAR